MPYIIKSLISHFLHPVPVLLTLLLIGIVLRKWERTRRLAKIVLISDGVLFVLIFCGVFNFALKALETSYTPFNGEDRALCDGLRGAVVTVLGNGFDREGGLPPRQGANDCFRQRLTEGAYVANSIPGSTLLLSMSGSAPEEHKRRAVEQFAVTYGIATNRIAFYSGARDTNEETARTLAFARTNRVVLVTSASHLPRAMGIFGKNGCEAVPAPCEYRYYGPHARFSAGDFHFGIQNIERFDRLMHETIGLLYEKVTSKAR